MVATSGQIMVLSPNVHVLAKLESVGKVFQNRLARLDTNTIEKQGLLKEDISVNVLNLGINYATTCLTFLEH